MKAFNGAHDFFRGLESIVAEQRHGSGKDHWEFTSHKQEGERASTGMACAFWNLRTLAQWYISVKVTLLKQFLPAGIKYLTISQWGGILIQTTIVSIPGCLLWLILSIK